MPHTECDMDYSATDIDAFTTARLSAERISLTHFDEVHRLHSDPEVTKTLSADGKPLSEQKTHDHLQKSVDHWERHGFGLWLFRDQTEDRFIGRGGLTTYQINAENVIGLAYAVMSDSWNRGFATEMAERSLKIGFERLMFPEIASWTLPVNRTSQRVMEKLGFKYERDFEFAELPHLFYRLSVDNWHDRTCPQPPQD